MKEYKVMVRLNDGKWYKAEAYKLKQDEPMTSLEYAQEYMKEFADWCNSRKHFRNAELKIMSREVTEWEEERVD